ncbi:hypothetical protein D3C72_1166300 [compost metagenome]
MHNIPPNQQTAASGFDAITGMACGMPGKGHGTNARENLVPGKQAHLFPVLVKHLPGKQEVAASAITCPAEIAIVLPESNLVLMDHQLRIGKGGFS